MLLRALFFLIFLNAGQADPAYSHASCQHNDPFFLPIVLHPTHDAQGFPIGTFSAWSFTNGIWQRIALQIDEVNQKGEYVLEKGYQFTAGSDDGMLDANDEMVIRGVDLGEDFDAQEILPSILLKALRAWKLTFCNSKHQYGAILLVTKINNAPFRANNPVHFDVRGKTVSTASYHYQFKPDNPVLIGNIHLIDATSRKQAVFRNSQFQVSFLLPWWAPNFTLTDKSFSSEIESWRSGPIRSIVAVGVKLKNLFAIFDFHMFSELVFYESSFRIPTFMEFPYNATTFLKKGSGLVYSLNFSPGFEWDLESNLPPLPKSPKLLPETAPAEPKTFGAVISSSSTKIALRADVKGKASGSQLPRPFLIRKGQFLDETTQNNWPWLRDNPADLGVMVDISGMRQGVYHFNLDLILDSKADLRLYELFAFPKADWVTLPLR